MTHLNLNELRRQFPLLSLCELSQHVPDTCDGFGTTLSTGAIPEK